MATAQASFEELLQCSICLDRFTNPKVLPCQHTFCLSCLRGTMKNAKSFNCPTCRQCTYVPKHGLHELQDNLIIKNLLDIVSVECNDCQKRQILTKCEHCSQEVCSDCRATHNRLSGELKFQIKSLQHKIDHLDANTSKHSLKKLQEEKANIQTAFSEAVQILNKRQNDILAYVDSSMKFHQAVISGKNNNLVDRFHQQLAACQHCEDFKTMQEKLLTADGRVEGISNDLEFNYDFEKVTSFGAVVLGESTVACSKPGLTRIMELAEPDHALKRALITDFCSIFQQLGSSFPSDKFHH